MQSEAAPPVGSYSTEKYEAIGAEQLPISYVAPRVSLAHMWPLQTASALDSSCLSAPADTHPSSLAFVDFPPSGLCVPVPVLWLA